VGISFLEVEKKIGAKTESGCFGLTAISFRQTYPQAFQLQLNAESVGTSSTESFRLPVQSQCAWITNDWAPFRPCSESKGAEDAEAN